MNYQQSQNVNYWKDDYLLRRAAKEAKVKHKKNRQFGEVQEDIKKLLEKHNIFKVLIAIKEHCNEESYFNDEKGLGAIGYKLSQLLDRLA